MALIAVSAGQPDIVINLATLGLFDVVRNILASETSSNGLTKTIWFLTKVCPRNSAGGFFGDEGLQTALKQIVDTNTDETIKSNAKKAIGLIFGARGLKGAGLSTKAANQVQTSQKLEEPSVELDNDNVSEQKSGFSFFNWK